jgi:hypothetical protein
VSVKPGEVPCDPLGALLVHLFRERFLEDDRVVNLSLSPKGKSVARDLNQMRIRVFGKICGKLEPEDCVRLLESHQFIFDTYKNLSIGKEGAPIRKKSGDGKK